MVTQPLSQSDFDPSSMVKLYLGALESWKKNYENLVSSMAEASPLPAASSTEHSAAANGQDVAVQLFQKAVEAEMELCRFYEKRWSQYLKLPQAMANCKSPMELAELQNSFCSKFTADYVDEGSRLFDSFKEVLSHSATARQ